MNFKIEESKYKIDDVWYWRSGWFGCQLKSKEWYLPKDLTREILGKKFFVSSYTKPLFGKYELCWCMEELQNKNIYDKNKIISELYKEFNV